MGIVESYSRATQSSNLQDDQFHHTTEKLAAVALSSTLGSLLFRVKYANDATSYARLLSDWVDIVVLKAAIRNWPTEISPKKIARLSLEYWFNDLCQTCGGKGYPAIENVPNVLSDKQCKACDGTGKRAVTAKHNLIDYVTDMVETLEEMTRHAGAQAIKKLAQEITLK